MCSHQSDSNEFTPLVHTIYHFQYKKENHPKLSPNLQLCGFSKRLKNEFETAVVNSRMTMKQPW